MTATEWRWRRRRNKAKKKKDPADPERACQHSASTLSQRSEPFIPVTLPASTSAVVSGNARVCLRGRVTRLVRRMLSCTGGGGFMCLLQMLRNRQDSMMNWRRQPRRQSKVNSLSIGGGEVTRCPHPGVRARLQRKQQLKHNCF